MSQHELAHRPDRPCGSVGGGERVTSVLLILHVGYPVVHETFVNEIRGRNLVADGPALRVGTLPLFSFLPS